ncbi:MAG TPA: T9SS type A sorting domain-containing protein [Parafilimonas sp.]|nr:T9SS type A sorting domain-containing protein [Parafilimonas sp.]
MNAGTKKIVLILNAFVFSITSFAQSKINRYEYWLDNDFNNKVSASVSPKAKFNITTDIDASSLNDGLHVFNIRFKDNNGKWSSTRSQYIIKAAAPGKLTAYEYWFDDKYGQKTNAGISGTNTLILTQKINTSDLSPGGHQFSIRFKDSTGKWSNIKSQYFFKASESAKIKEYEYWFDDNYNQKTNAKVSGTGNLIVIKNLRVNEVSTGYHRFNIRFKDVNETWSATKSSYFIKFNGDGTSNIITGIRYWFDAADTTIVNITIASPLNTVFINDSVAASNLSAGYHTIHYQVKDISQLWSNVYTRQFRKIGGAYLETITPNRGGNTGYVTANIYGDGFYEGTQVKLAMGNDTIVVPDSMMYIVNGNQIVATLNLYSANIGDYDVIVSIPNDTILISKKAFHVESGQPVVVYSKIVGPLNVRLGQENTYTLSCENVSNINANGSMIWLAIPDNVEYKIDFQILHPDSSSYWDSITPYITVDTLFGQIKKYKVFPLIIPIISPKEKLDFTFSLKLIANEPCEIQTWSSAVTLYQSPINGHAVLCIYDLVTLIAGFTPAGCISGFLDLGIRPILECHYKGKCDPKSLGSVGYSIMKALLDCISGEKIFTSYVQTEKILRALLAGEQAAEGVPELIDECRKSLRPNEPSSHAYILPVTSIDPNEKYGPISLDTLNKYVSNASGLNYVIQFENDSSATAPAQTVRIYDTLDKKVFNPATFQLGNVTIGDTTVSFRKGVQEDSVDINLAALGTFFTCRVKAKLIDSSKVIYWYFQTLNSYTLKPAAGIFDGFLPPNTVSPKGIGEVSYSIKVYDTLKLKTAIKNKAHIYFDYNPGVSTQTWQNKLDNAKPFSKLNTLPAITSDSIFTISWSGSDKGSGILNYDIYYKVNNGNYDILLSNTSNTAYSFHGKKDSTYSFYSIARDSALNIETTPSKADASTTIKLISVAETHINVKCNGGSTASIQLKVTGAKSPVQYLWSNGAITKNISSIPAGTYSVIITDAAGATVKDTILITQPAVITVKKNKINETSQGAHDGSAKVTPSGGIPPYTYLWNTGATTQQISGLTSGKYKCTATDSNGCKKTTTFTIINTGGFGESIDNGTQNAYDDWFAEITPNPTSGIFSIKIYGLSNEVKVFVVDGSGKKVFSSRITHKNGSNASATINLSKLSAGHYYIVLENEGSTKGYKLEIYK